MTDINYLLPLSTHAQQARKIDISSAWCIDITFHSLYIIFDLSIKKQNPLWILLFSLLEKLKHLTIALAVKPVDKMI